MSNYSTILEGMKLGFLNALKAFIYKNGFPNPKGGENYCIKISGLLEIIDDLEIHYINDLGQLFDEDFELIEGIEGLVTLEQLGVIIDNLDNCVYKYFIHYQTEKYWISPNDIFQWNVYHYYKTLQDVENAINNLVCNYVHNYTIVSESITLTELSIENTEGNKWTDIDIESVSFDIVKFRINENKSVDILNKIQYKDCKGWNEFIININKEYNKEFTNYNEALFFFIKEDELDCIKLKGI